MKTFDALVKTVRVLRSPGGCPWDREQTIHNYKKYLLEEMYELIDEINVKNFAAAEEEMGDLFLILIILSEMFREKGYCNLQSILRKTNQKLIARHPHVFGSKRLSTKEEVLRYWIKAKAEKKKRKTIKDRLPKEAPALLLADIFLKEQEHVNVPCCQSAKRKIPLSMRYIDGCVKEATCTQEKERVFTEALFCLCRLAYKHHVDAENLLRAKIFKEAAHITYRSSAQKR